MRVRFGSTQGSEDNGYEIPRRTEHSSDDEASRSRCRKRWRKEMEEMRVEASAGGGVVNVTMKGDHEIISLKVDPEIVKEGDIEMLQDMIVAAINEGNRKVNEAMKSKLGSMLPPGLGNLF